MKNLIKTIGLFLMFGLITEQVEASVKPQEPVFAYKLWIKDGKKFVCRSKEFWNFKGLWKYTLLHYKIDESQMKAVEETMKETRSFLIATETKAFYIELYERNGTKLKPISNKRWKEIQNLNSE